MQKESGVRSQESGVRSQESEGRKQEKHLWNAPPGPTKVPNCFAPLDNMSDGKGEWKNLVTFRTYEQHGNVYENKGSGFHNPP
jgi:hypothetical protein